jgi:preprotein translocase subunit SecG
VSTVSMILFLLCGVILTLLILIQRGRGGGLAGAFGGAGGSSAFGTKTADVFVKATAVLGAIFFVLAIVTALLMRTGDESAQMKQSQQQQAPATPGGEGEQAPAGGTPPAAPQQ